MIQKNLVYIIGLSIKTANYELLKRKEYLGQYGNIIRLIVNNNNPYNPGNSNIASYSAYVTYSTNKEASLAILALDNTYLEGLTIRASFGSNKYCSHFLKNTQCVVKECLFFHNLVDESDYISKEENTSANNKRQELAIELSELMSHSMKQIYFNKKSSLKKPFFPTINSIYSKEIVLEYQKLKDLTFNKEKSQKENKGTESIDKKKIYR